MTRIGVIADDFTGGTDIAGHLVADGLRTVQWSGVPPQDAVIDADALVISLKSRSVPAGRAIADSLSALDWLQSRGFKRIYFKYCSTFDSTPQGNIGPVTDALMQAMGVSLTLVCPALPVNGRTVYNGYLFVGDRLLNESGMRNHPVNPMTDADLVRLMQAQSRGRAALVPHATIKWGVEAVREALDGLEADGVSYAVVDAIDDEDLLTVGRAVHGHRLLTGGSGLAHALFRAEAESEASHAAAEMREFTARRAVVLSGSCSQMSVRQVAAYAKHAPCINVDVSRAIDGEEAYARQLAGEVFRYAEEVMPPLVSATTEPEELAEIQKKFGARSASDAIEAVFAHLAVLLRSGGYDGFVVAGGETSGAVSQALRVEGFVIGPEVAPGVPLVRSVDGTVTLALKSGNFGDENFFERATAMMVRRD